MDLIGQLEDGAHLGSFRGDEAVRSRVLLEIFFENFCVVQIFRDDHAKASFEFGIFCSQADLGEEEHRDPDDQKEECGIDDEAHSCEKTDGHGDEDRGDLAGRTLCGTKTHETECSCYRDACADVAVDGHDDHADNGGKDGESSDKGTAGTPFQLEDQGQEKAEKQGAEYRK